MSIWVVASSNRHFLRGSYNETKFSKKSSYWKYLFLVIAPFRIIHSNCLNIDFWQDSLYESDAFSILILSTKNSSLVLWKRFSFYKNFASKLKYWKCLKFQVIPTEEHADLSYGRLFWKSPVLFLKRAYTISVSFKMKLFCVKTKSKKILR